VFLNLSTRYMIAINFTTPASRLPVSVEQEAGDHHSWFTCCGREECGLCRFPLENRWVDLGMNAVPLEAITNSFLPLVIPTWQARKILRWVRH
jgi:hypothetical protein